MKQPSIPDEPDMETRKQDNLETQLSHTESEDEAEEESIAQDMEIDFVSSEEDLVPDESEEEIFTESRPQSNQTMTTQASTPLTRKRRKRKQKVEISPKNWKMRQNGR